MRTIPVNDLYLEVNMAKNIGWEAKSNHDGSYTVTVNGKQYYCADTHEFLHFLEDIGERWEDSEIRKG